MRISIHLSQSEDASSRSEFILEAADFSKNFQGFLENYGKEMFLNVHLLCKKHFTDCFFVLSVVFEKYLKNLAIYFCRRIGREIRHVLAKFA